ncbi:hypothetical protein [Microvirga guangxiensis]|uniref:Uncharacterized protein n=1 Tax=Microvirga guangxiensis TaxID=549386 RepID=A0A1G5IU05_9HYPH|nr:hypothetical protein [Microvirga guangxiensis]SCY79552.1 hypothetical protein SAMN02927923_02313 [Microvirga guangxiensis]
MQRVIAYFSIVLMGAAVSGGAFAADGTRSQHQNWMQKLETPGGTLPGSFEVLMQPDGSQLAPAGTTVQHRSWIKKREILDSSPALPL